jgi:hypothetical protein
VIAAGSNTQAYDANGNVTSRNGATVWRELQSSVPPIRKNGEGACLFFSGCHTGLEAAGPI